MLSAKKSLFGNKLNIPDGMGEVLINLSFLGTVHFGTNFTIMACGLCQEGLIKKVLDPGSGEQ